MQLELNVNEYLDVHQWWIRQLTVLVQQTDTSFMDAQCRVRRGRETVENLLLYLAGAFI